MLDAKTASAFKDDQSQIQTSEGESVSVEEQRAQKHDRFLRRRQIACMIYDPFRAARAYDAEQDLSYLSNTNRRDGDGTKFY